MVVHHRPRVLIVEDDPDTLVILRINLTAAGVEPMLAGDGRTAIERIEAESPDAVLLDVLLPGIDGWQVLEQLHAKGDPVPVIVCSGKDNMHDLQRARDLGAVAYLVKPFDIDRLIEVTSEVVGLRLTDPVTERGTVTGTELA
ncbi:MAG TPA: response regulator [Actinomycetota bacterium]|nr:response regulator [Actinomycetota bacterium]